MTQQKSENPIVPEGRRKSVSTDTQWFRAQGLKALTARADAEMDRRALLALDVPQQLDLPWG